MEACKFTSFIVAMIMVFSVLATFGAAQDGASAPTPSMQSAGVSLQVSGLVAVIASFAALLF
ncbi:hypothetical protein SOVF_050350 [Spinacia oleracea]|nr:hypothetical protein SOVF_050350 [Spinacia oleracea]